MTMFMFAVVRPGITRRRRLCSPKSCLTDSKPMFGNRREKPLRRRPFPSAIPLRWPDPPDPGRIYPLLLPPLPQRLDRLLHILPMFKTLDFTLRAIEELLHMEDNISKDLLSLLCQYFACRNGYFANLCTYIKYIGGVVAVFEAGLIWVLHRNIQIKDQDKIQL